MKDFTIRVVLSLVVFLLPLIPLFIIEPVHKGTDMNTYSFWGGLYLRVFSSFIGVIWYVTARRIVDKFLGDDEII